MNAVDDRTDQPEALIADSGLFIACGRQDDQKYRALERFARRRDLTFVIPRRVYEELVGAPDRTTPGQVPIDDAIDSGWVRVADEPAYSNSTVSTVMDDVRAYIARSSNRDEYQIEKADTALGGVAAELLSDGTASSVTVVTTDIDAGEGVVTALENNGFEDRVRFVDGFEFVDDLS